MDSKIAGLGTGTLAMNSVFPFQDPAGAVDAKKQNIQKLKETIVDSYEAFTVDSSSTKNISKRVNFVTPSGSNARCYMPASPVLGEWYYIYNTDNVLTLNVYGVFPSLFTQTFSGGNSSVGIAGGYYMFAQYLGSDKWFYRMETLVYNPFEMATKTYAENYATTLFDQSAKTVKVSLTSAEILNLSTTPKVLIAAPGANKIIQPLSVLINLNYGTTPYATNTSMRLATGTSFDPLLSISTVLAANDDTFFRSLVSQTLTATNGVPPTNLPLTLYVPSGNPTAGDSTFDIYVTYVIITL